MNWRGRPLVSHEVIVNSSADTKTTTGLKIKAELGTNTYPLGVTVSDEQLRQVNIDRTDLHGEWNYTISSPKRRWGDKPPDSFVGGRSPRSFSKSQLVR